MTDRFVNKRPLFPLIGIGSVILILIFGLLGSEKKICLAYLLIMYALFFVYGYWKSCLAVLPVAVVLCLILGGITFVVSHDPASTLAAVNRILAVCVAVIPGLAMEPIALVRGLSVLKLPRMLTLAMMITLEFFPLLAKEVKQVREAMNTRGAGSLLNPKIFYRAFLIPLMVRLVNISDTLALSVETRGFSTEPDAVYSVYKTVSARPVDIVFLVIVIAGGIGTVLA